MKKIWFMLLLICGACAFTACSDDDDKKVPELSDLLTDIKMPEKFLLTGAETEITGKGFVPSNAKLFLEDEIKKRTEVKDAEFTTTGVYFKAPETAGSYTVILVQDNGEMILGEIKVVEPITDVIMPIALLKAGEKVTIQAKGLRTTAKIILEDIENNRTEVDATISETEVVFNAPAVGYYTIILSEDNNEDVLGYFPVVSKRIAKITQIMKPLQMEEEMNEDDENIEEDGEESIDESYMTSYIFKYTEGTLESINYYDAMYEEEINYIFSYTEKNKVEVTAEESEENFTYILKNGVVSTYSYYGDYHLNYDENGYLTLMEDDFLFSYDNGNLVDVSGGLQFKYDAIKNNCSNIDLIAFMLRSVGVYQGIEPLIPYLLGKSGKISKELPVKFISEAYGAEGTFDYQMNGEQVVGVKYIFGEAEYTLTFEYED